MARKLLRLLASLRMVEVEDAAPGEIYAPRKAWARAGLLHLPREVAGWFLFMRLPVTSFRPYPCHDLSSFPLMRSRQGKRRLCVAIRSLDGRLDVLPHWQPEGPQRDWFLWYDGSGHGPVRYPIPPDHHGRLRAA